MIKANQTFLNFLQVLADTVTVALALLLAYWIRFVSPFYTDGIRLMNYVNYIHLLIFVVPVYLLCFLSFGLYKPFRKTRFYKEFRQIFLADSVGILITVSYLYYTKDINYSRLMLGYFYLSCLAFMAIERYFIRFLLRRLRKKGYNLKHVLVVGAGIIGHNFVDRIQSERELGYNIIGYIDDYFPKEDKDGTPILGTTQELEEIISNNDIDEVVIALPNASSKKIDRVIDTCEYLGVKTQVIPDYVNLLKGKQVSFDELDGIPLINTRYIPLDDPFNAGLKRCIDVIGSIGLLLFFSPLMIFAAVGVKTTSPGPIIYKQNRVGKNRKEFTIYKFRSMVPDESNGTKGWTVDNDPRKTKFGSFIRKYSIDELPQLFNVLKGDMSLVGPRPELPFWVEKYRKSVPHYMTKHHVRPGLTGLAQVRGLRGDTDIAQRIDSDMEYIENWNLLMDLKIMLLTPNAMLHGN